MMIGCLRCMILWANFEEGNERRKVRKGEIYENVMYIAVYYCICNFQGYKENVRRYILILKILLDYSSFFLNIKSIANL